MPKSEEHKQKHQIEPKLQIHLTNPSQLKEKRHKKAKQMTENKRQSTVWSKQFALELNISQKDYKHNKQ